MIKKLNFVITNSFVDGEEIEMPPSNFEIMLKLNEVIDEVNRLSELQKVDLPTRIEISE